MKVTFEKILFFLLIVMMPIHISMQSNDNTETNLRINGTFGQYAHIQRSCYGNVIRADGLPLNELGLSIDHKTKSPFRFGIHTGYLGTKKEYHHYGYAGVEYSSLEPLNIITINPFINIESKYVAIGGGYVVANQLIPAIDDKRNASGYLRIGNVSSTYFDISLFHTTPLISTGIFKLGIGNNENPEFNWWIGVGGVPHDKPGLIYKANFQLQSSVYLNALLRLGMSEGISECAVGLGLTYRLSGEN